MLNVNKFYVYAHKKATTGEVFYVGKGFNKRAFNSTKRNPYWHNTVNKHGFVVEFLAKNLTEQEAFNYEILMIKTYRENSFILVNMTEGGDGVSNPTDEVRNKMRKAKLNRPKEAHGMFGRNHSDDSKIGMRINAHKNGYGENNSNWNQNPSPNTLYQRERRAKLKEQNGFLIF